VTEHLRECGECRALERRVERIDRLLALREPMLALPARVAVRSKSWLADPAPRLLIVGLAAVLAIAVGSALRDIREESSTVGAPSAVTPAPTASRGPQITGPSGTLGGISLGMSGDEVRAILGEPDRTTDIGVRWEYDRGLTLHFLSGPVEDPVTLTAILATAPGAGTADGGVAVGDPEDAFLDVYRSALRATLRGDGQTIYIVSGVPRGREQVALLVTFQSSRATSILLLMDDRAITTTLPLFAAPTSAIRSDGETIAIGPYQVDLRWREALEDDSRKRLGDLTFVPLIPEHVTYRATPIVTARGGCGAGGTCLEFEWYVPNGSLRILQGPAGCCLDAARPGATRDLEIRPGVLAQLIPNQDAYGGRILWWTEPTATGDAYIAISGPHLDGDELLRIARSMRPLD